jgi:hypothetical protein
MSEIDWGFPITGSRVAEEILSKFSANEVWEISYMDIPSGTGDFTVLNDIRDRVANGPVKVSSADLCNALAGAPQVWVLDMRLSSDDKVQLCIEDGEVFEMNLGRK